MDKVAECLAGGRILDIIIGGDLVPTESNIQLFNDGNVEELLGKELLSLWMGAYIRVFNLEVPLTDKKNPICKCGPNLIAPTSSIKGIKALNPTLIALANNHIMDQGVDGLHMTMQLLDTNAISYVGAGANLDEAKKPYIFNYGNIRIGFYACAEHEFSIATASTPGANPFDPLESLDHIQELKSKCDYVIVLYHGGKEHYRYPSPHLQKVCRKIAEKGADLVICQHSHCIGCCEKYRGSIIVFGQGNFIFDRYENDYWQTSLLIKVSVDGGFNVEYIPVRKVGNVIRLADEKDANEIMDAFQRRSSEILQEGFIEQQYRKLAFEHYLPYIRSLAGFRKWLTRVDVNLLNGFLSKHKYSKNQLFAIRNYIECEAHRELLLAGLRMKGLTDE